MTGVALLSCGGASDTSHERGPSRQAPKKVTLSRGEHIGGPRKLSPAEQKAMGIEQAPRKMQSKQRRGTRLGRARGACAEPERPVRPGRAVAVPLVRPLTSSDFALDACIVGGQRVAARYIVDSGADLTTVPEGEARQAGLKTRATRGYMLDANGVRQPRIEVALKMFQLSDLQIENLELTTAPDSALFGQDILNQFQSWMLDHDGGVLRLGMRPPSTGYLTRAPLKQIGALPGNFIQVRIAGRSFLLKLDTGAFSTSISREVADSLRLPKRKGRPSVEVTRGVHSQTIVRTSYEADIEIGGLVFEGVEVMPLPSAPRIHYNQAPGSKLRGPAIPVVGLLGADVLLRHNIVVRPHKDISFYERKPTEASAAERITRWPWVPVCDESPGCARAKLVGRGGRNVVLALEQSYPQAAEFLFACLTRDGAVNDAVPYVQLTHPRPQKGKTRFSITHASRPAFRAWSTAVQAKRCRALRLIDVQAPAPGRARRIAQLAPSSRFWLR